MFFQAILFGTMVSLASPDSAKLLDSILEGPSVLKIDSSKSDFADTASTSADNLDSGNASAITHVDSIKIPTTTAPNPLVVDSAALLKDASINSVRKTKTDSNEEKTARMLKRHGEFYFAVPRTSSTGNDPILMEKYRATWQGALGYISEGAFQGDVQPFAFFLSYTNTQVISAGRTTTLTFREPYSPDSLPKMGKILKGRDAISMSGISRTDYSLGPALGWENKSFSSCVRLGAEADADGEIRNDAYLDDNVPYFRANFLLGYRIEPYFAWKKGLIPFTVSFSWINPIAVFSPFAMGLLENNGSHWKLLLAANLTPGRANYWVRTDVFSSYEHNRLPLSKEWTYTSDQFSIDFRIGHLFLGAYFRKLETDRSQKKFNETTRLEIREYGIRIGL